MQIAELSLTNFRNIHKTKIKFNNKINIIYGKNGQGKTSILEAVYLLAITKSFRSSSEKVLLGHHKEFFDINGYFETRSGQDVNIRFYFSPSEGKNIFYNGNRLTKYSELIGRIPVVLLSLENLELTYGVPANRRRFMDLLLAQVSPVYLQSLQAYKKILQHRNSLLSLILDKKEKADDLFPWDEQLAEYGSKITQRRYEFVNYLNRKLNAYYREISQGNEEISVKFKTNIAEENTQILGDGLKENYLALLKKNQESDIQRKTTSAGPHRDDLLFLKNGYIIKTYGSQGENKTLLIALKFAESDYIKLKTAKEPILLMDDVFGELDNDRIRYLMNYVTHVGQTFITTTLKDKFKQTGLSDRQYFQMEEGKILQ